MQVEELHSNSTFGSSRIDAAVEIYKRILSSPFTTRQVLWRDLPTLHNYNLTPLSREEKLSILDDDVPVHVYKSLRSAVCLKNVSRKGMPDLFPTVDPKASNMLPLIRTQLTPNLHKASTIDVSVRFKNAIENERSNLANDIKSGPNSVRFAPVAYYDCAFDSLLMGLMAGLYHLQSRFPEKYGSVLDGESVTSASEYMSLNTINKLTCRIEPTWVAKNMPDRPAVLEDYQQTHAKLADYCKSIKVNYENDINADPAPSLFVHHFLANAVVDEWLFDLTKTPATIGNLGKGDDTDHYYNLLASDSVIDDNDDRDSVADVLGSVTHNFFANEADGGTSSTLAQNNYVQSLLDYIRLMYQTIRYGFRGTAEMVSITNSRSQSDGCTNSANRKVGRMVAISMVEEKGVFLPHIHTNFLHFYAQNLQMEGILKVGLSGVSFTPQHVLRYKDGTSTVDGLTPSLPPLRTCTYKLGYDEFNMPKATPANIIIDELNDLGFAVHPPATIEDCEDTTYQGIANRCELETPYIADLMGLKTSEFFSSLLTIDTSSLTYDDDPKGYDNLHPYSAKTYAHNIFWRGAVNHYNRNVSLPLAVFSKEIIEGILSFGYSSIGDMFRLDLNRTCAMYYFGTVQFRGAKYAPVAITFCNAQLHGLSGGSQGHFWVECKLSSSFGTSSTEPFQFVNTATTTTAGPSKTGDTVFHAQDREIWFRYDNLSDQGSEHWDLLVSKEQPHNLLPIYGGRMTVNGTVTDNNTQQNHPASSAINYRPCRSNPFSMKMIRDSYVSMACVEDDGIPPNALPKYRMMKVGGESKGSADEEWYLVFDYHDGGVPKIDSVFYAKVQ